MIQITHYGREVLADEELTEIKNHDILKEIRRTFALQVILNDKDKNVVLHDFRVDYDSINGGIEDALSSIASYLLSKYPDIKFSPHDMVSRNVIVNFKATKATEYNAAWDYFSRIKEFKIKGK